MLKTKLSPAPHADMTSWNWAIENGSLFRVSKPKSKLFFDVLLLGSADYVAVNIGKDGLYDPKAKLTLYSVNGEFRVWVEENGMAGRIRGVRWAIEFREARDNQPAHYNISGDCLAPLAIEQIMGEIVNKDGEIIGNK